MIVAGCKGHMTDEPETALHIGQVDSRLEPVVNSRTTKILGADWRESAAFERYSTIRVTAARVMGVGVCRPPRRSRMNKWPG